MGPDAQTICHRLSAICKVRVACIWDLFDESGIRVPTALYTLSAAGRKGFEQAMMLTAKYFQISASVQPQQPSAAAPQPKIRIISRKACPEHSRRDAKHVLSNVEGAAKENSIVRLCENSFGALRPGSGRTVKYFTLLTSQPVRAEAPRSMDGFSHSLSFGMKDLARHLVFLASFRLRSRQAWREKIS
jgi:hypothetical protein